MGIMMILSSYVAGSSLVDLVVLWGSRKWSFPGIVIKVWLHQKLDFQIEEERLIFLLQLETCNMQ